MMKKQLTTFILTMMAVVAMAIPAKRGITRVLTLTDGTQVTAELRGDEHVHFWQSSDGRCFVKQGDAYVEESETAITQRMLARKANKKAAARTTGMRKVAMGQHTHYTGKKKGIVILVEYKDVKFKSKNNLAKYQSILNEEGYTSSEGFQGSVSDYFKAQSGGIFELDFDVVGPITMKNNRSYYGGNNSDGDDQNPEEMIIEACKGADSKVNFKDYDWDGDGEVDQVFVLYAGVGEADGGTDDSVWPHMYYLYDKALKLDGVTINTYACSNEVDPSGHINGIGTFCHEFSHCLGYPDFYDTSYSGNFGMGEFDLMEAGSYNGDGFLPAGYSAYEKWMAGWLELTELSDTDMQIDNIKPISEGGMGYIIYNQGHRDEYYIVENRQLTGWDAELPGRGLMITHVDFDADIWEWNCPNTMVTKADMRTYGYPKVNDHQRFTIFHADNDDDSKYWNKNAGYYTKTTTFTDLYPYLRNDSLTSTSKPAATVYNTNKDGSKLMGRAITGIKQNTDKTMNFSYRAIDKATSTDPTPTPTPDDVSPEGALFYESFDQCASKGGNDNLWGGNIANGTFTPDMEGWTSDAKYGANQCARFGTSKKIGLVTTPAISIDGEVTLYFKAAPWSNTDGTALSLSVSSENVTISPSDFTLTSEQWTQCQATITGTGSIKVSFLPSKRLFLDEVIVKSATTTPNAILTVEKELRPNAVYSIDGRYMGTSLEGLKPGIYVVKGKKIIK